MRFTSSGVQDEPRLDATGPQPHVLLVDNDGAHCHRMKRELVTLGCGVSIASSPRSALTALRAERPQLVAVEPLLTRTSWFRFLHHLCQADSGASWIVVTAYPSTSLAAEATKLGALGFLAKPVSGAELMAALSAEVQGVRWSCDGDFSLAHAEWEHLNKILRKCEGNMTAAARLLRIPRQSLYNKLRKVPPFSPPALREASE